MAEGPNRAGMRVLAPNVGINCETDLKAVVVNRSSDQLTFIFLNDGISLKEYALPL